MYILYIYIYIYTYIYIYIYLYIYMLIKTAYNSKSFDNSLSQFHNFTCLQFIFTSRTFYCYNFLLLH